MRTDSLTRSRLLAKNTLLNFLGYGAPLVVAVLAIPLIIEALGKDRFGILTLAWVLIGYLSLLDLGLGRALTKIVADKLGQGLENEIPGTIWSGMAAMVILAAGIGVVFAICGRWITYDLLKIPEALEPETLRSLYLISAFVPVVVCSVGFRGILEAYQRFDIVNYVRIPLGIFYFCAPLAVIPFSLDLSHIVAFIFLGRLIAAVIQFACCRRVIPGLLQGRLDSRERFGELLRLGGWMTVTNIVNPLLVFMDRFLIGAYLSVASVAFYATPSEVLAKLFLISGAIMSVLFPAIASSYKMDRPRSALLLERGLKFTFVLIFPVVLSIIAFAHQGLAYWLDAQFAQFSLRTTQLLAAGFMFACIGQILCAFIQAAGRPELTGKLHLCELPVYLVILIFAINRWGITGAALVWAVRALADTCIMYLMAQQLLKKEMLSAGPMIRVVAAAVMGLLMAAAVTPMTYKLGLLLTMLALFGWFVFSRLLSAEERSFLKSNLFSIAGEDGQRHGTDGNNTP